MSLGGRIIPRCFWDWVADGVGALYARTHPEKAALLEENMKLVGSDRAYVKASKVYGQFCRVMGDYFYLASRPIQAAIELVDERHGFEHLQSAQKEGTGALLLMPHLSFFELGGAVMKEIALPMIALTNPEPSEALTRWRAKYRARWGVETLQVGQDPFQFVEITRHLEAGKFVAAVFDRPHPTQSYAARLPGGKLYCSSGILLLAMIAGCPVIPVTVLRKQNGKYRLDAYSPMRVTRKETIPETLEYYTQKLMDVLWPAIYEHPDQWFQFSDLKPALGGAR